MPVSKNKPTTSPLKIQRQNHRPLYCQNKRNSVSIYVVWP